MLTHLRIKNFKSWEDTGRIRLAPVTVFFGPNSSGKSSLGQFLLVLKQTAESTDRTQVLRTSYENAPADVGDFSELIHHHDTSRELVFELGWRQERQLEIEDAKDPQIRYSSRQVTFDAEIYQPQSGRERMRVRRFAYSLGDDSARATFAAGMEPDPRRASRYRLDFRGFTPVHNRGRAWELPPPARFYGFPDEAVAYFQNTDFLPDLSLALERTLGTLSYLGPLRVDPKRTYNWLGGEPPDVGTAGEETIQAILAGADRRINLRHKERLRSLPEMIAYQLKALGLIESFRVVAIAKNRPEHEVRVKVHGSKDEVLLTDVGFGISQVLPVLVQSFYAPPNSTVLMEQPELHLHPRVQMELADFFVAAAGARQEATQGKSVERRTQFLIESHSEHFLRRLQRRIAEQRLVPEQVALYFCEMKRGQSTLRELDVDLFGNIHNWPQDFFGDPMEDIAAQAEARLEREIQAGSPRRVSAPANE
jgi:predicted ATPase